MAQSDPLELTDQALQRFLSLMSQPARLGDLLRRLHELRALEKIVPSIRHARCLLQFNEYHKYTVDEHSIRAVEAATEFLQDPGPLGEAYRGIRNKRTLHLALLLHDLGKGYPGDHSDVGLELADATVKHLKLPASESETIKLLVHKHLLMAHLALRHDLNDDAIILQLAATVGTPSVLQMLYVLTCADLAAVGPGVLNDWKVDLITDLYHRTWRHLTGESPPGLSGKQLPQKRAELLTLIPEDSQRDMWEKQIAALPSSLLAGESPQEMIEQIGRLIEAEGKAIAWSRYSMERQAVEYTLCAPDEQLRFHRIVGVLTSSGNQILAAEIHQLADGLALDRFYVNDLDHDGEPPSLRLGEINRKLEATVGEKDATPSFRRIFDSGIAERAADHHPMPTRVTFDNNTTPNYTIISIFAYDRIGLLYSIAKALFDEGLSVHLAKISTNMDQVVDVFYVTDWEGRRIEDEDRLGHIRRVILDAIEAADTAPR